MDAKPFSLRVAPNQVKGGNDFKCHRFEGKVAVITGSTDGIGLAIAERLAAEGAAVVVSSRKKENVDKAVNKLKDLGYKVTGIVCHVGKEEDRRRLFQLANETFGGVDILVANAAVNPGVGPILKVSESAWDKIFEINVKSCWQLSQLAVEEFAKRGGGNILFIGSGNAYELVAPIGAYGVSKTALLGLTKAIAREYAEQNIRVNCLVAGMVKTAFAEVLLQQKEYTPGSMLFNQMQRVAVPMEIAGAAAFMVSDDASYMTGENVVIAGGHNCHL